MGFVDTHLVHAEDRGQVTRETSMAKGRFQHLVGAVGKHRQRSALGGQCLHDAGHLRKRR